MDRDKALMRGNVDGSETTNEIHNNIHKSIMKELTGVLTVEDAERVVSSLESKLINYVVMSVIETIIIFIKKSLENNGMTQAKYNLMNKNMNIIET